MLKLNIDINTVEIEIQETKSVLYPNPTSGEVKINFGETLTQETILYLIDENGKQIFTTILPVGINSYTLQTNNWQSGIYFIKVNSSPSPITFKLILQK